MKCRFWLLVLVFQSTAWADSIDIIVGGPEVAWTTELPSGDYDLKTYRASINVIQEFSKLFKISDGELKNFPKAPDCTQAEVRALKLWGTNEIYQDVNKTLREVEKGKVNGVPVARKTEVTLLMVASGLNCAPQYEGIAVRMETPPGLIMKQYQPGNYLLLKGFTSATKGEQPSKYFWESATDRIRYDWVRGADVDSLGIATWPDEHEVLVRPGTVFRVLTRNDHPNLGFKILRDYLFQQF